MSSKKRSISELFISAFFLFFVFSPTQAFSSSTFETISMLWSKVTTPASSFILENPPKKEIPLLVSPPSAGMAAPVHSMPINAKLSKLSNDKDIIHDNILFSLLTFGHEKSKINLNSSYIAGKYFLPYAIFTYDNKSNWYYWAAHSDAPSVILYGYSWLINVPAKILDEIDAVFKVYANLKGSIYPRSYLTNVMLLVDITLCVVSLIIEIPLAIINTLLGAIISLIWHPFDSLCSLLGMLYLFVPATVSSIWGIVANVFLIPYHIFVGI